MPSRSPLDALEGAIYFGLSRKRYPAYQAPGSIIARLPPDTREALSRLTPEILATARDYPEDDEATAWRREVSRMKQSFDARCKTRV